MWRRWPGPLANHGCHCRSLNVWSVGWCASCFPGWKGMKICSFHLESKSMKKIHQQWSSGFSKYITSSHLFVFDAGHTNNTSPWRNWMFSSPSNSKTFCHARAERGGSCERKRNADLWRWQVQFMASWSKCDPGEGTPVFKKGQKHFKKPPS